MPIFKLTAKIEVTVVTTVEAENEEAAIKAADQRVVFINDTDLAQVVERDWVVESPIGDFIAPITVMK